MTNTKKRRKLLWGMQMMMRDIKLFHGWHEPLRSYMRLYQPNGVEDLKKAREYLARMIDYLEGKE